MDTVIFEEFMEIRFPKADRDYIEDWRKRFQGGNPEKYMDSKSLKIYKALMRKYPPVGTIFSGKF